MASKPIYQPRIFRMDVQHLRLGYKKCQELFFLFVLLTTASRVALRTTQPPYHNVPGIISLDYSDRGASIWYQGWDEQVGPHLYLPPRHAVVSSAQWKFTCASENETAPYKNWLLGSGGRVQLKIELYIVLRHRMCGVIPPLPSAYKRSGKFTFILERLQITSLTKWPCAC
jgi:hypothetical protein